MIISEPCPHSIQKVFCIIWITFLSTKEKDVCICSSFTKHTIAETRNCHEVEIFK